MVQKGTVRGTVITANCPGCGAKAEGREYPCGCQLWWLVNPHNWRCRNTKWPQGLKRRCGRPGPIDNHPAVVSEHAA